MVDYYMSFLPLSTYIFFKGQVEGTIALLTFWVGYERLGVV